MNWPLFLGSLAAILALSGAAWALGLGGAEIADEAEARAHAEALLSGFEASRATLTADGAEVTGADGRRVRLRRLGARFVADEIA